MPVVASFWQVVGWMAGFVIIGAVIGFVTWRRRGQARRLSAYRVRPAPSPPRKPNGEDRRA